MIIIFRNKMFTKSQIYFGRTYMNIFNGMDWKYFHYINVYTGGAEWAVAPPEGRIFPKYNIKILQILSD